MPTSWEVYARNKYGAIVRRAAGLSTREAADHVAAAFAAFEDVHSIEIKAGADDE